MIEQDRGVIKNPIQPIVTTASGVVRFKENAIVRHLLDWATERGMGLNELAVMDFTKDDRQQLAQLIGYSLSGYGSLDYVDDDSYCAARAMFDDGLSEKDARVAHLEGEIHDLRTALREPMSRLFGVHPEDLSRNMGDTEEQ